MSLFAAYAASSQQRPTFRAAVDRVRVDVIVTDSGGRFVDDLVADDFLLFEDGVPQEVIGVQRVDLSSGTVMDLGGGRGGADIVRDRRLAAPVEASADLGALVFLVDFPGLNWRSKFAFARAWEDLLTETDSLSIPRAVYLMDQQLRFRELAPLTNDAALIQQAAREVRSTPLARKSLKDKILDGDTQEPDYAQQERIRALFTLEVLARLCEGMSVRDGRTALVWVSSGIFLEDLDTNRGTGTPLNPDMYVADLQIIAKLNELREIANSSNVSVYAVDPSSHAERQVGIADAKVGSAPVLADLRRQNETLDEQSDPLVSVAVETGGEAFVGWSDLDRVLRAVEEDTSHYYLLTYAAPVPYNDGEYHSVRVEVSRPGVDVRARGGYVDYTDEDRRSRLINGAISAPGMATDLALRAEPYLTWSGGKPIVMLAVSVDAVDLVGSVDATGTPRSSLEVHAAALDGQGKIIAELTDTITAIPGTDLPVAGQSSTLIRKYGLSIDPGQYDLRVMVLDEATSRVGATQVDLVVPEVSEGDWHVGDPMLLQMGKAGLFQPVVAGHVSEGNPVNAYIEVYHGGRPEISGRVRPVDATGDAMSAETAFTEIFRQPLVSVGKGIHRGILPLPGLPVGEHVLQLFVTDLDADHGRSFDLRLRVVPPGSPSPR